jgi:hypothetical protein
VLVLLKELIYEIQYTVKITSDCIIKTSVFMKIGSGNEVILISLNNLRDSSVGFTDERDL